ncbi:hypothetical protein FHL15_010868 [Xylaria flabelliformis]|uniref:Uncharacterized protein n=1 Tax=Xylaria flabelliformis TaxID=2512241 RepID=A0A553HJY3_9PEZI|nr:hypothetical protein FHL15_010868 [Xylaria flabelliformis]
MGRLVHGGSQEYPRTLVLNRIEHEDVRCISMIPSRRMLQSFIAFLMEAKIQVRLGLDTPPTQQMLGLERNTTIYHELQSLESSTLFRNLLRKNAYGRRFFMTVEDRFGMTAVQDVSAADPSFEDQPDIMSYTWDYMDQNDTGRKQEVEPGLNIFEYCGECYLYDAMDGEAFKVRGENGQRVFAYEPWWLAEIAIE